MSKFLKFIVNLFLTVAILTAVAILVPPFLGINTTIVDSAGMDTNLPLGSVTYSKDIPVTKLKSGDEILKESGSSTYAYIIKEGDVKTGKYKVVSAVDRDSSSEITLRNSVSRVSLSIPYIGYIVVAMQTVEGIIIIVLIVLFIIILFILSELWKSRDEDDDGDEDDNTVETVYDEVMQQSNGEMAIEDTYEEPAPAYETPDAAPEETDGQIAGPEGFYGEPADGDLANAAETDEPAMPYSETFANAADLPAPPYSETFAAPADIPEETEPARPRMTGDVWNTSDFNFADELAKQLPEKYPSSALTADGSDEMAEANAVPTQEEAVQEEPVQVETVAQDAIAGPEAELGANRFIAVERLSLDQILEQARKRGGEPVVRKDGVSGIDIVDYSRLIIEED